MQCPYLHVSMFVVLIAEVAWYTRTDRHRPAHALAVPCENALCFVQENKHRGAFLAEQGKMPATSEHIPNMPVKAQKSTTAQVAAPQQVRPFPSIHRWHPLAVTCLVCMSPYCLA